MASDIHTTRRSVASRIKKQLSEYGLELVECGSKNNDLTQPISPETGYWSESSFNSKPSRLIVHVNLSDDGISADIPEANLNRTFAYANTGNHRSVGGLLVRTVPVFAVESAPAGGEGTRTFHPYPDWEWVLYYIFSSKLRSGTSGEVFKLLDPQEGTFHYKEEVQPYVQCGLVGLLPSSETFSIPGENIQVTYEEVTTALAALFKSNVSLPTFDHEPERQVNA